MFGAAGCKVRGHLEVQVRQPSLPGALGAVGCRRCAGLPFRLESAQVGGQIDVRVLPEARWLATVETRECDRVGGCGLQWSRLKHEGAMVWREAGALHGNIDSGRAQLIEDQRVSRPLHLE